jgi:hypothetical protein
MNRPSLSWCGRLALMGLLPIVLILGCGDDKSTTPKPDPNVSMSLQDANGLINLTVRNTGGAMDKPSLFVASFTDGSGDTIPVNLAANDSMTCQLSNIHGGVTVTNEDWDLEGTTGDCLAEWFENYLMSIDMNTLLPSPVAQAQFGLCTYTIYLSNFSSAPPTFQMTRTDDGLTLRITYSNITYDLSAPSPGALCVDITGDITISSVVIDVHVDIGDGQDPEVTLGNADAEINGLNVNIDGTFGFLIEWITGWVSDTYTGIIENSMAEAISSNAGQDLSYLVTVNTDCAE